ncbi:SDR family NAD(P)-dependent oxidoreductase [Aliiglaciecola sp. LCG003]|uniref:SDR family NAD(P)-dependent oxidoreductase n=1 Tax=Aliiglaciecola sp. LCG003 TaxID=3053655 RepID=UPI0025724E94|nr:SDR family NAD(P)-dependent oxidoreductase [Aliiglaciecola sp. LCG003]WJG10306.1 SDR family NAD(P)-dependent oxidoreductase [Aliiglaciecola sp. LCG003]
MAINFKGKTALISGAAGGIGLALAQALGQKGMNIVLADIDTIQLDRAVETLRQQGIRCFASQLDVTEYTQWQAAVEAAVNEFGGLHMLINNAGVGGVSGTIEDTNHDTWRWVVDVNLMGVLYGTQAATPALKQTGEGGWIVNVASMAGMMGVPYSSAYAATKAAVVSMSESWMAELAPHNIHVSVLCPAFVKTRIHESMRNLQDKYKPEQGTMDSKKLNLGLNKAAALVESGISTELLANRVLEALESGQHYIFTHPNYRPAVKGRAAALDKAFEDAQNSPLVGHLIDQEIARL